MKKSPQFRNLRSTCTSSLPSTRARGAARPVRVRDRPGTRSDYDGVQCLSMASPVGAAMAAVPAVLAGRRSVGTGGMLAAAPAGAGLVGDFVVECAEDQQGLVRPSGDGHAVERADDRACAVRPVGDSLEA